MSGRHTNRLAGQRSPRRLPQPGGFRWGPSRAPRAGLMTPALGVFACSEGYSAEPSRRDPSAETCRAAGATGGTIPTIPPSSGPKLRPRRIVSPNKRCGSAPRFVPSLPTKARSAPARGDRIVRAGRWDDARTALRGASGWGRSCVAALWSMPAKRPRDGESLC